VNTFPERFGDFLLLRRLATSLMAEVFVAIRLGDRDGRTVIIKRPKLGERASGESAQAILREAEVLGAVRAPTLVALEAHGEVAGLPYVAIEHVRGVALDRLLAAHGAMSGGAALAVGRDILRALSALHEAGWVHADVAPSNIVVDDGGEAKLIDLGIAMRKGEARDVVAGKPGYVAPEVPAHKPAAPAEDVYAAAVVIVECMRGKRLFPEQDIAEAATRTDVPHGIVDLPNGDALAQALAITPSERVSARDLANVLADDASARSELARLVAEVEAESRDPHTTRNDGPRAGDPRYAKTEIGMPIPSMRDGASSVTTRGAPAPLDSPSSSAAIVATPGRGFLRAAFVLGALAFVALALVVGFVAGRRNTKTRPTSITLPVVTPRTEVTLDGRTLIVTEPGRTMPIDPGEHTLSFSFRKREKDLVIGVAEGQNVVLVPVLMQKPPDTADKPDKNEKNEKH
jgi:serine/threonine protein kinase